MRSLPQKTMDLTNISSMRVKETVDKKPKLNSSLQFFKTSSAISRLDNAIGGGVKSELGPVEPTRTDKSTKNVGSSKKPGAGSLPNRNIGTLAPETKTFTIWTN